MADPTWSGVCLLSQISIGATPALPPVGKACFSYANALAKNFFGISDVRRYSAEGLDIFGADTESILQKAKLAIAEDLQ